MKYEKIKIGDVLLRGGCEETVISKIDEHRIVTTIDFDGIPTSFREKDLHYLKPIKEELPEEGLLVSLNGSLVYKLSDGLGYGFEGGQQSGYYFNDKWHFHIDGRWRTATKEEEKVFVDMLKKECKRRGLLENTKIEANVEESNFLEINDGRWLPEYSTMTSVVNKQGQIFYKGKFATPLKEKSDLEKITEALKDVVKYEVEEIKSGAIILTPLK